MVSTTFTRESHLVLDLPKADGSLAELPPDQIEVLIDRNGAYSVNGSMFDVWLMLGFGVAAYYLKAADFPIAPLILAFVLTPRLESSIRRSFDISNGDPWIFVSSPISVTLVSVICALILMSVVGAGVNWMRKRAAQ